jgi:PAS domain S-box-containing protein
MSDKPTYEELEKRIQQLENAEFNLSKAEKALREGEDRFRAVVEDIPAFICSFLPGGQITFVNKAYCEYFNKSFKELVGANFLTLIPKSEHQQVMENISGLTRESPTQTHEHQVVGADGQIRWHRWTNRVLHDAQNKIIGYQSIGEDITDRKGVEETLRFQAQLLDSVRESVISTDLNGNVIYWNKGAEILYGFSPQEVIGKSITFIAKPGDDEEEKQRMNEVYKTGSWHGQYVQKRKDGTSFWASTFISLVTDEKGKPTGYIGIDRDITEHKRAAEALRIERDRAQQYLDTVEAIIVALDSEGRITLINKKGCNLLGYDEEELLGQIWFANYLPQPEGMEELYPFFLKLMTGELEQGEYFENPIINRKGELRQIAWHNTLLRDKKGKITGTLSAGEDITERKRAEEALRTSHQRFLTVLNSIDATIYVADLDTHEILFMNKYMIESFGRDMTGETCWSAFRGNPEPCAHCTNNELVDDKRVPTDGCVWQSKNPITGKWYINHDRAIEWTDGRLVRLQIATDITKLKRMEEALHQAHKMDAIGTLAGGIAHDFNNLLMGIQGRASLISVDLKPSHPHREHIKAIEEYIQGASDLTKQLLGFVRRGKYEVKPLDLNMLLRSSADMFGRTCKEVRIHTQTPPAPLAVEADKRQIEQVLLNLFVNAWQAMPAGGELYLETSMTRLDGATAKAHQIEPGLYIKVSVTDTGIGMDETTQQRIFDPFFTTKQKGRGTGLGLASAYGIVNNHGGIITVYSEVGQGTTFNIYLPASKKEANLEVPAEGKMIRGSETILLVDDEEMVIDVGKAMLEKLGYRVLVANEGKLAIDAVQQLGEEIDLVVLDLIMPGMDGSKVFDGIRKIQPRIPVILSSGYAINGKETEKMITKCNGFIQKPFNLSELSQKVRNVLNEVQGAL